VALLLTQGGVKDARALVGGWAAWVNAGHPVKTGDTP
jgi:3-mercaptopyruvate sulfurtransferase SseA